MVVARVLLRSAEGDRPGIDVPITAGTRRAPGAVARRPSRPLPTTSAAPVSRSSAGPGSRSGSRARRSMFERHFGRRARARVRTTPTRSASRAHPVRGEALPNPRRIRHRSLTDRLPPPIRRAVSQIALETARRRPISRGSIVDTDVGRPASPRPPPLEAPWLRQGPLFRSGGVAVVDGLIDEPDLCRLVRRGAGQLRLRRPPSLRRCHERQLRRARRRAAAPVVDGRRRPCPGRAVPVAGPALVPQRAVRRADQAERVARQLQLLRRARRSPRPAPRHRHVRCHRDQRARRFLPRQRRRTRRPARQRGRAPVGPSPVAASSTKRSSRRLRDRPS